MNRYLLPTLDFNPQDASILTLGYYDGDRPALNYLPNDLIAEFEHIDMDIEHSFVLVRNPSLQLAGFVIVNRIDFGNRPNGLMIHSIGYINTNRDVFDFIINQLKTNLTTNIRKDGRRFFDYLWGYDDGDRTFLREHFNVNEPYGIFYYNLG